MHRYGAFIVGVIGGLTYISWETILIHSKVDDALNAVPGNSRSFICCFELWEEVDARTKRPNI